MIRCGGLLLGLLLLPLAPAAGQITSPAGEDGPAAEPDVRLATGTPAASAICLGLDEGQETARKQLDEAKSFFDPLAFTCDGDLLDAEEGFAPLLRRRGQESFRPYDDSNRAELAPAIHLRSTALYMRSNYQIVRIDCEYLPADDSDGLGNPKPKRGRVVLDFQNEYIKPDRGKFELALGAADCGFIAEWLEEYSPGEVTGKLPFDPEGEVIPHAGKSIFEAVDIGGRHSLFHRYGSLGVLPDPPSDAIEGRLDQLMAYFANRAKESGRKVR